MLTTILKVALFVAKFSGIVFFFGAQCFWPHLALTPFH